MTDSEWQSCTNPYPMLIELTKRKSRWKWSTRKARLFACACCRRVWKLLRRPAYRQAIELAERVADKQAKLPELKKYSRLPAVRVPDIVPNPVLHAVNPTPWGNFHWASIDARNLAEYSVPKPKRKQVNQRENQAHCELIRDIVGLSPKLPAIDLAWLKWHDATVVGLAQKIYDERRFEDLPILADALEEAGCTNAVILDHCRGPGPHARGCWVVDILLGKE